MVSSPGKMQATFTSGELDVMLIDRTQLKYFSSGAKRMENVHIHPQGGFSVAGRMRHLSVVRDDAERMISFVNSDGKSFDLVIAAGLLSIWKDGAHFKDLQLPHSLQQISELNHVQSLDTLLLFHRNVPTRRIRQFADDDWRIEELAYENTQPGIMALNTPTINRQFGSWSLLAWLRLLFSSWLFLARKRAP
ncbi:hypothetical protein [Pseudovibrio denitrificans]|uniref:hypothetical protein n=1 Tax=Pseudovibrio denitrificans TaxID=258256 RepID=UPI0006D26DAB|nr:hypothetical protein [Pseudovibrio denitrificans]